MSRSMVQIKPVSPPLLWSKLPEQTRRQLAIHLVPALRARLRGRGENDVDSGQTAC